MALQQEALLVPQVLDHLQVRHHVDRAGADRQRGEVAPHRAHARVDLRDVGGGERVVVQPDDLPRGGAEQVRAVALTAPGLEHHRTRAVVGEVQVCGLVPAEPVVLLRDAGDGAFPGERQLVGGACGFGGHAGRR